MLYPLENPSFKKKQIILPARRAYLYIYKKKNQTNIIFRKWRIDGGDNAYASFNIDESSRMSIQAGFDQDHSFMFRFDSSAKTLVASYKDTTGWVGEKVILSWS